MAENGKCGLNFEHAWGDGACVLGFFDKIHEHILENSPLPADIEPLGSAEVNEVYFVLDDDLKTTVKNAGKSYQEHIQDLVIAYARVSTISRGWGVQERNRRFFSKNLINTSSGNFKQVSEEF